MDYLSEHRRVLESLATRRLEWISSKWNEERPSLAELLEEGLIHIDDEYRPPQKPGQLFGDRPDQFDVPIRITIKGRKFLNQLIEDEKRNSVRSKVLQFVMWSAAWLAGIGSTVAGSIAINYFLAKH